MLRLSQWQPIIAQPGVGGKLTLQLVNWSASHLPTNFIARLASWSRYGFFSSRAESIAVAKTAARLSVSAAAKSVSDLYGMTRSEDL